MFIDNDLIIHEAPHHAVPLLGGLVEGPVGAIRLLYERVVEVQQLSQTVHQLYTKACNNKYNTYILYANSAIHTLTYKISNRYIYVLCIYDIFTFITRIA